MPRTVLAAEIPAVCILVCTICFPSAAATLSPSGSILTHHAAVPRMRVSTQQGHTTPPTVKWSLTPPSLVATRKTRNGRVEEMSGKRVCCSERGQRMTKTDKSRWISPLCPRLVLFAPPAFSPARSRSVLCSRYPNILLLSWGLAHTRSHSPVAHDKHHLPPLSQMSKSCGSVQRTTRPRAGPLQDEESLINPRAVY